MLITAEPAKTPRVILLEAIALICVGYAYFNISDAALKLLSKQFHFSQIVFIQMTMMAILMGGYGWWKEGIKTFQTRRPKIILLRAIFVQIVMVCNIFSFAHVPLTTFYTLVFTSPFWVTLLSAVFLKDKLDVKSALVIGFGFLVIVGVFQPWSGEFNIWWLVTLTGAFFYSCQLVITRSLGQGESRSFLIISSCLLAFVWALPLMLAHFTMPTLYQWGLFGISAVLNSIGLLCVIVAFQTAPSASSVAPFHYTQIIWGALLGYFLFHEIPTVAVMVGAALIISAGLYLLHAGATKRV